MTATHHHCEKKTPTGLNQSARVIDRQFQAGAVAG